MTEKDLIDLLTKEKKISILKARSLIKTVFLSIKEALKENRRIEIRGFGSFKVKSYKAYIGRNPRTHEKIEVKAKKLCSFKVGKDLSEKVNRSKDKSINL